MGQLLRSTENLIIKRDLLLSQVENLLNLRDRLTQDNQDKVIVLLGGDYFVEKTVKDAGEYLQRRLSSLKEGIDELSANIKHAEKTTKEFQSLQETEKGQENGADDGKLNEEGLPFIDIREEIDEDGNVLSVNLNDEVIQVQPKNAISALTPEKTLKLKPSPEKQLPARSGPLSQPVIADDDPGTNNRVSSPPDVDVNPIKELFEDMEIISGDKSGHESKGSKQGSFEKKIDDLKISGDDKASLLQIYEEFKNSQQETSPAGQSDGILSDIKEADDKTFIDTVEVTSTSTPKSGNLAIDRNDLLELELLASEFDDIEGESFETSDVQDEEWYFDDEEEDDDEDDEYADSLLYGSGKAAALVPSSEEGQSNEIRDLLWKNITQLRQSNGAGTTDKSRISLRLPTETSISLQSALKKGTGQKRKSVTFSESLEIKEIANVSEELKNITYANQNMSRFKQNRMMHTAQGERAGEEKVTSSDQEGPVSELVVERNLEDSFRAIVSDVVSDDVFDHDSDSFSLDEQTPEFSSFEGQSEIGVAVSNEDIFTGEDDLTAENDDLKAMQLNLKKAANKLRMSFFRQMKAQYPNLSQNGNKVEPGQGTKIQVRGTLGDSSGEILDRRSLIAESIEQHEDTVVRETKTKVSPVMNDVVDKDIPETNDIIGVLLPSGDKVAGKASRFKSARQKTKATSGLVSEKPKNGLVAAKILDKNIAGETAGVKKTAVENESKLLRGAQAANGNQSKMEVLGTALDYTNLQEDMDTMAKAYVLGMYDDDIATEGPVVNKLDDFEVLNRMVESMPSEEAEKKPEATQTGGGHAFDPDLDEVGDFDGPVLADEIMEHNYDDDDDDWGEDAVQQNVIDLEVSVSYYRMREKMIVSRNSRGYKKTEQEQEMEPVDADGNPVRVSRFKAARLNMN